MSETLRQGSYTRNAGFPAAGRDSTQPRFHIEAIHDEAASAAAGRPIFRTEERVQFIQPGSPNQPVFRVDDSHKQRWPEQYEAFRRGEDMAINGTPIEQWPILKKAMVYELKALGIFTIEQCSELSDLAVQKIGMGGRALRERAKAYLDDAEATAITERALAAEAKATTRADDLQRQLDELRPMMDKMFSELQGLRNAPSAVEAYIPPQQFTPAAAEPMAPSSLEGLGEVRRGPGRPRKEAA